MSLLFLVPLAVTAAAEAASNGNATQLIVAALGAGSVGAVLAAMVTGLFTKRKLGAEATEIITKAASGVVESLNAEIIRVNAAMAAVRLEAAEGEARHRVERDADRARHNLEMTEVRRVLQLHVAWDMIAKDRLQEHGIELPDAPPLLPPLLDFSRE